jgi:DNA-binding FadR family transcriptional regulator
MLRPVKNDPTNKLMPQMNNLRRGQLLYQSVQDEIKSYIIQHALKPGDPLPPETELAQQLGISRNSVREAVKSLETLGILEARSGAGLFVRDFSFDPLLNNLAYGLLFDLKGLHDILEVRFHIEYGLIERAIEAVSPEQLERLYSILEQMRVAAAEGTYSAELDRAFHKGLWENVENYVAGRILDIFWIVFYEAKKRESLPDPPDPNHTYERHKAIVAALEKQDIEAMQATFIQHYHEGVGYWPWHKGN